MLDFTAHHSALSDILEDYSNVYVIISPPRCSSTAFARMFWEQPSVRYYSHEPFEATYYMNKGFESVIKKLSNPLDLQEIKHSSDPTATDLVIKEMPYQVGHYFSLLPTNATTPIIFLVRDPRLNIASRIEKKIEVGDSPFFPLIETGWELLQKQIKYCRAQKISHMIVDSTDFRNNPRDIFPQIFRRFDMTFCENMLTWEPCTQVELDNLDGLHRHLYTRVLESTGLQQANESMPSMDFFPTENGVRNHVEKCREIYEALYMTEEQVVIN